MNIFFISPIGKETKELFPTFIPTFQSKGHIIVNNAKDADVVFIDLFSGLAEFNEDEIIKSFNKPIVYFDATDYGGISTEIFNFPPLLKVNNKTCYVVGERQIMFVRKMYKTVRYGNGIYPYELTQYPDHIFEPTTKEELFNRPFDICFIGNTSPTRLNVCNGLKNYFKCDFVLGQPRIEHNEWLKRHRQSKLFLVADGGGFNDERVYQLIYISALLKQRNNQLVLNDFEDGIDCIKIHEFPNDFDIEDIRHVLSEPEILYSIYLKGIEKMKTYFNDEYRANYILKTLADNGIN